MPDEKAALLCVGFAGHFLLFVKHAAPLYSP